MEQLTAQLMGASPHVNFLFFSIMIPNLVMGLVAVAVFFAAAWLRLPHFIEHGRDEKEEP